VIPTLDPSSAIISREKVTGYLLSSSHPIGRYKAAFFATLGYSADSPDVFERDLANLLSAEIAELDVTEFGRKFSSRGPITGPNGRQAYVLAIWIILSGENSPRLVTAYPEDSDI
jgi:hypothetical protein